MTVRGRGTTWPREGVRDTPQGEWTYFSDWIRGFEWEPGFEYRIRVMIREIEDPPADGSPLEYRLLQVLEKTPAAPDI